jgi:hypothetical protein
MTGSKCRICQQPAKSDFCSNECFAAHVKTGGKAECAVCQVDRQTGRVGNLETNRLCTACRRAEENTGWIARWRNTVFTGDVRDGDIELADLIVEKRSTDLVEAIKQLAASGKVERVPYIDRQGNRRGTRPVRTRYSAAAIARQVGCSRPYVAQVLKRLHFEWRGE